MHLKGEGTYLRVCMLHMVGQNHHHVIKSSAPVQAKRLAGLG